MSELNDQTNVTPEQLSMPPSTNQDSSLPGLGSLKESVDKLITVNEKLYRRQGLGYSFIHGLLVAMGSTIGLAVVLAILGYILSKLGLFESFKSFLDPYMITK